jgi:hypothetical protein
MEGLKVMSRGFLSLNFTDSDCYVTLNHHLKISPIFFKKSVKTHMER